MAIKFPYCKNPELWAGIECSINRIDNNFRDQLDFSGHYLREDDIDKFASLGIKKLRYPVLWEKHQPKKKQPIDWEYSSIQLNKIRSHGIDPIVGLIHHGSGPSYTELIDPDFPEYLAEYAGKVAEQFPWIKYYTPVNEPLTTARFSGLYGYWYPHHRSVESFAKMLLHQVKATVLSMKAIRTITPDAKLVQTEDLAMTHSTPKLNYQANFENERRWLTYDLLCGKVDRKHYFWKYFTQHGIDEADLDFFLENPCPPDIMGFNYYITSERFLDENIEKHPLCTPGGNEHDQYVDIEVVRVGKAAGLEKLLCEAWERYQLPLAVTECHLSCTREEQLRWFAQIWEQCCALKSRGVDLKAVTAWSLLGAYDWDSLLTQSKNNYEPGVFDVRNNTARPTAVAKLIRSLSKTGKYEHPVLSGSGWWEKNNATMKRSINARPLLITGKNGTLGQAFMKICEQRSIPFIALSREELNISNANDIQQIFKSYNPWAVINTAGYVRVDEAEINTDACFAANAEGPMLLAKYCNEHDVQLMTFSSDLVFDGAKGTPYSETDELNPLNVYGMSKAAGENFVRSSNTDALIIRTSAFFGPWDKYNFVFNVLENLEKNQPLSVINDIIVSPTYVPDLADTAMDLFIDGEKGIWHVSNKGMLSWADFGTMIAERGGYDSKNLIPKSIEQMAGKAKLPLYSALHSQKGIQLPGLDNALDRYFEQRLV